MIRITVSVDLYLVARYETIAQFEEALEDFLNDNTPCYECDGEGWVTPQDHPIDGPQADRHCPLCHGEKWEAPF